MIEYNNYNSVYLTEQFTVGEQIYGYSTHINQIYFDFHSNSPVNDMGITFTAQNGTSRIAKYVFIKNDNTLFTPKLNNQSLEFDTKLLSKFDPNCMVHGINSNSLFITFPDYSQFECMYQSISINVITKNETNSLHTYTGSSCIFEFAYSSDKKVSIEVHQYIQYNSNLGNLIYVFPKYTIKISKGVEINDTYNEIYSVVESNIIHFHQQPQPSDLSHVLNNIIQHYVISNGYTDFNSNITVSPVVDYEHILVPTLDFILYNIQQCEQYRQSDIIHAVYNPNNHIYNIMNAINLISVTNANHNNLSTIVVNDINFNSNRDEYIRFYDLN